MAQSMVVSMTGFAFDPREAQYKKMITDLKWRLAPTLSEETRVLIANDVSTEKYKIAKTYQMPITCVTIDWLLKCHKMNQRIETDKFQIKKLFYGVLVIMVAFQQATAAKLKQLISDHGGQTQLLSHNRQLNSIINSEDQRGVILTTHDNFNKLKHHLDQISLPIVELEWVQDSIRNKFCKFPHDYALNLTHIPHKEPIEHYSKMKKKLQLLLSVDIIDELQHKLLENTFIYFGNNVNGQLASLLKKLVMVYGGFYLQDLVPVVTHILTQPVTENQLAQLRTYGVLVSVVRVEWLIDSIYIHKKMKEEDYFIRSFKSKIDSVIHLDDRYNSMTYNSYGIASVPTLLHNRRTISVAVDRDNLKVKHPRQVKATRKFESTIFKGKCFYIESTLKKETQLSDLTAKIVKHSGQVFTSRADIKSDHCYYVLKDTVERDQLIERLKVHTKNKCRLQPVSHRWVNDCLAKGRFIDLVKTQSYIYKPFNFKTPILGFHKMIFDVLGLDQVSKLRLKQLYNTLGSAKNTANKIQLTHCLCGTSFRQSARYREIKKENQNVKYVSWKWLIDCVNACKIIDMESYLLDKEQIGGTQDTQNSLIMVHQTTVQ